MGPLVFLINGLTKHDWLEALLFAVAVTVGLTPEMLPMIVTVNLAKGAVAMARAKVIVKRLNAIQNLGAIAVAYKDIEGPQAAYSSADECDLTLLGYIAFLDPPKDSAREAIARLASRGVQVKILTGDNEVITRKICREVNIDTGDILLGARVERMSGVELAEAAGRTTVFAKLTPAQKERILQAPRLSGHVVGFLGDGINDSPALKAADVGISVDTAVDIAKESADIVVLEKSLLVLQEGVTEGRKIFANITKYIKMGANSNFGNMFSVLGASLFLPFLPMLPIQVLTNNLLYDFSQTAIPTDNVDEDYIAAPRRWDISNILFMVFIGPISSIFDYAAYAMMLFIFDAWSNPSLLQTGWFVESLLTQTLIIHIIRTARIPFIESHASPAMIATTVIICLIGIALPFTWAGGALGFVPLPTLYWPLVAAMMLSYAVLTHLVKVWFVRRWGM
jgi:P-type Mg2+ transporter